ncbi:MAG: phosphoenolpyruvate--protein phosphotransferase, partial [Nannocystaceae bacterium]
VVDRRHVQVPHSRIERDQVEAEQIRFHEALVNTRQQLETIKGRLHHGEHRQILKAQQMMLRDPDLIQRTELLIRDELQCAEWAVATATDEIHETLDQADNEYFRERRSDIAFLAERLLLTMQGDHPGELQPPPGSVIVAHDLNPADTASLYRAGVMGIATEAGGKTSHSSIMARSLQIPAVLGIDGLIASINSGDLVIVDGVRGVVIVDPDAEERAGLEGEQARYAAFELRVQKDRAFKAVTHDGLHVVTRANLSITEDLALAIQFGAEGVGLYRSEYMFIGRDTLPTEAEHYKDAKRVLRKAAPHPVVYRTFDLGSDKKSPLLSFSESELNPAMGMRSLRLALRERDMFLAQLRGLLRAAVHGPLRIMMPFVSSLEELEAGLQAIEEAREQLEESGMPQADYVPIGVMIETPAAALTADILAQHVDFMSIGTNDLLQYTLAIDRDNDDVQYLYQPLHPAILRLIHNVAKAGQAHDVPVSLCGEMAADPRYTWVLAGLGIREMSMHPSAIPVIKDLIRGSKASDMDVLAQQVLSARSAAEAERIVYETMHAKFPEHLEHGSGSGVLPEDSQDGSER